MLTKKNKCCLLLLIILITNNTFAQNVGINSTGAAPSAWAMLDVAHTTKGLLIPRVALLAINNASPIGLGMPVSTMVYNTATAGVFPNNIIPGYYYWAGTKWVAFGGQGSLNWGLLGNAGTVDGTNFIGTTDNVPLNFRVNNQKAGIIDNINLNTYYGFQAGNASGTSGDVLNTGIGYNAFFSNTTGERNTATGARSLYSNISGKYNTAIGNESLYSNISGNHNLGLGASALSSNTLGSYNIAVGSNALNANSSGNLNVAIGSDAMRRNTGSNNTSVGYQSLWSNLTGNRNTALGDSALYFITGSNNIGIGTQANVPLAAGNNQVRIGNTAITYVGSQVAWTITSDKRWKSEIKPSNLGLDFIKKLNPVYYIRNNDESKKTEYGFIAQEVDDALTKFDCKNNGIISKDDEGMLGMRYNDLIAISVKAIQEQQQQIIADKEKIKALEERLQILESKLK